MAIRHMRREAIRAATGAIGQSAGMRAAIPDELFPVRERFRSLIIERIMALEAMRITIENGQDPDIALASIVAIAHKIAGVAATLGFAQAGDLAAAVEQQYRDSIDPKVSLKELWQRIQPQLIDLMDELESLLDT